MAFVRIPGLAGKVYVPDGAAGRPKKHDCRDCFACQHCGDDRCGLCRTSVGHRCPPSPPARGQRDGCVSREREHRDANVEKRAPARRKGGGG